MATNFKETGEKLKEGIKNLKGDAEQYRDFAEEGYREFREKMSVYREGANEFIDAMGVYIKENPQKSALIASGIGFGFGMIVALLLRGGRRD